MPQSEPGKRFARRAFLTLFLILAAHTLTETARDALFLSRLPVTQLPWMYLLVALVSVPVSRVTATFAADPGKSALPVLLLASAAISCCLWMVAGTRSPAFLYLLYLWPAVFSSVVIVEFWRSVSDAYTITEAKSIFGWLGAGATAGSAVGSGVAVALSTRLAPPTLLLAAATIMAIARVCSPAPLLADTGPPAPKAPPRSPLNHVRSDTYLRRVAACLFLATIVATLTDVLFKGIVTRALPSASLATAFASVSFGVNVAALVVQMTLVGPVIRRLGVTRSLAVTPSAISIAAVGLLGVPGLAAAVVVRVTDSTLRYSLHRAIANLLYVPLTPGVRARVKAFIDVSTQRVGQVVGSVAILAIWRLGGGDRLLAAATLILGFVSVVMALRLAKPYLDVFRTTLKQAGTDTRLAYPNLDVESLSSLVAAFNSEDERVVVAAMDLVAEQDEVQVIPVVMLFHPSRAVVLHSLELFERHQRQGSAWALERLRKKAEDPEIRAAALSAHARQHNDDAALRAGLDDPDETVRMTALVGLVSGGWMNGDAAARALSDAVANASVPGKASLAAAMRRQPSALFESTLVQMAGAPDVQVRARVAEAMARMPSTQFLPSLLSMLSVGSLREPARQALVSLGEPALDFLDASLHDERLPRTIRIQIPRSISRFDAAKAVPVLWRRLLPETDELVQFKILRGINRLVADAPEARPNAAAIASALQHVSLVGLRYARWRMALEHGATVQDRSDAGRVLIQLLADKQARATESIFRLLALDNPAEDLERIYRGLHGNRLERASGHELLESVVHPPAREVILALLDDANAHARQPRLAASEAPLGLTYDETLAAIVQASTGLLHTVAVQHAAEASLVSAH